MNNKLKIILPIVLVSSSAFVLFQIKNSSNQIVINQTGNSTNNSTTTNSSSDELNSTVQFQKLSIINNRCRGCGKCVRIDPAHFEMQGRVATITSSTNLDSSSLKLAINNCSTGAIVLE